MKSEMINQFYDACNEERFIHELPLYMREEFLKRVEELSAQLPTANGKTSEILEQLFAVKMEVLKLYNPENHEDVLRLPGAVVEILSQLYLSKELSLDDIPSGYRNYVHIIEGPSGYVNEDGSVDQTIVKHPIGYPTGSENQLMGIMLSSLRRFIKP